MVAERKKRKVRKLHEQSDAVKIEHAVERGVEKALKASRQTARTQVVSFFDFIRERGVMGLAIGIIIGSSVTILVQSLVNDIINPIISAFLVDDNLEGATFTIGRVTIGWGNFVSALLDFLVVALAIYILFRVFRLEKLDKKPEKKP